MIFFKILQQFLSPNIFVFVLILLGLILIFKRKKAGRILLIIALVIYYFFSITPAVDLILKPLEGKYQPLNKKDFYQAEKIVLLLGEGETDVLRASEVLRFYSQQSMLNNQQLKIIISGASALNPKENPGLEVKKYLSERGIPEQKMILEDKSRNAFESARNLKEIIGQEESFFLVTSAYHVTRSMEIFQKMGMNPIPTPTDFKIQGKYNILDYFPDGRNLRNSDLALHEYFGILFYRLRY